MVDRLSASAIAAHYSTAVMKNPIPHIQFPPILFRPPQPEAKRCVNTVTHPERRAVAYP